MALMTGVFVLIILLMALMTGVFVLIILLMALMTGVFALDYILMDYMTGVFVLITISHGCNALSVFVLISRINWMYHDWSHRL